MAHFAGSSLIPPTLFDKFENNCVTDSTKDEDSCNQVVGHIMDLTKDIYIYGTEFPVCPDSPLEYLKNLSGLRFSKNKIKNEMLTLIVNQVKQKVEPVP